MIVTVDHVQICIRPEEVERARDFYCGLLGLREVEKPESLKSRGGFWLEVGDRQIHVGVEEGVDRWATKAHVAYRVVSIESWRQCLTAAGFEVFDGPRVPGHDRFEFRDPFGNRVEMLERLPASVSTAPEPARKTPMARPDPSEYVAAYTSYVALVPEDDILSAMQSEQAQTLTFLRGLSEREAALLHLPYTWTPKQVVNHLADAERIFGYRALRFARGDSTPLPGFDENAYAETAGANHRPFFDLVSEFEAIRRSHLSLFKNLPLAAWQRRGIANANEVSVLALAYIIVGHERHHMRILRQRFSLGVDADQHKHA
jgi:catechol 2,3-dioxygenase-like lactoylglutathione lyase family enzyme